MLIVARVMIVAQGFLRVSHKLAKRMPRTHDDEDRLADWCSDSLVTMQVRHSLKACMHKSRKGAKVAGLEASVPKLGPMPGA